MVPAGALPSGAVWTTEKKAVVRGFDTTFVFMLDPGVEDEFGEVPQSGGIAFVIQNASATPALATAGGIGYDGIVNSVAVEFDAHSTPPRNDPPGDHISVHTLGTGANSAFHGGNPDADLGSTLTGTLDTGSPRTGRVVYDAAAQTLKVYLDGALQLTISNFDLEATLDLDEGRAWIGLTASNGNNEDNGNSELHSWSATFPTACGEDVFWERELSWTDLGYNSDQYDHRLTGEFVKEGDIIQESLVYISDNVGLTPTEIGGITGVANSKWEVVTDTRHGITGLWRGRLNPPNDPETEFDDHGLDIFSDSILDFFENQGGIVATAVFGQIMKIEGTEIVVGLHRITYRLIKLAPETTEGGSDCYNTLIHAHQVTRKDGAFNPAIWPFADTMPPLLPCPP